MFNGSGSQMWQTNANGTSSGSTGPSSANSSTGYIYLEASNGGWGSVDYIESNSISQQNISVSFYYHMYGWQTGNLKLQYSTNNGVTWQNAWTRSGQQHSSNNAS